MPTTTAPAAGEAMPAGRPQSRRTALALFAAASAGALVAPVAGVAADDPDAALTALLARWRVARQAHEATAERLWKADQLVDIPRPDVLRKRDGDERFMGKEDVGEYFRPETIEKMGIMVTTLVTQCANFLPVAHLVNRYAEVEAAYRQWQADIQAAKDGCGYEEIRREEAAAEKVEIRLRRDVAAFPARTISDLLAKMAAIADAYDRGVLEDECDFGFDEVVDLDAMAFSAVRDSLRLSAEGRADV